MICSPETQKLLKSHLIFKGLEVYLKILSYCYCFADIAVFSFQKAFG